MTASTRLRSPLACTLGLLGLLLIAAPPGLAQDPAAPKDEGLEKLLEKIDDKAKPKADEPAKPGEEPAKPAPKAGETKDEGLDRLLDKLDDKARPKPDEPKAGGALAPKDEGLDKLLEGLGQTKDQPAPEEKRGGPGGKPDDAARPGAREDKLEGSDKPLDARLEELTGRRKPKKGDGDGKDGDDGQAGPMGDIIKEMREVEGRLGKPDTGEETRKKQSEIVKNLDTMIERMKNSPSQSQAMKMMKEGGKKPGQGQPQPGQPSNQPGAMAGGTGASKPEKPKAPPALAESAKSLWGDLPPAFRDEINNVSNETPLPNKADLIRLYFLSLGKKSSTREE